MRMGRVRAGPGNLPFPDGSAETEGPAEVKMEKIRC